MINDLINIFIPPEDATAKELEEAKRNMDKDADYRTYLSFSVLLQLVKVQAVEQFLILLVVFCCWRKIPIRIISQVSARYYDMFMDESLNVNPSDLDIGLDNQLNFFTEEHESHYGAMINDLISIFIPPENATVEELGRFS